MNYFIYTSHHFTPHRRYELNKLTSFPMCRFIAQLVGQSTGNAEVTGSNPVEALIFFRLLLSNCLNWKIYCDDHSSLSNLFCCFFCVITVNAFWKFLRLENLAWDFCRLIFGPRNFLGFVGCPTDFLGLIFAPI